MSDNAPRARLPSVGTNLLLASLNIEHRDRLLARMEPVQLSRDHVLCDLRDRTRYSYFPKSGLMSILAVTQRGDTVAIATVGHEGVIGWPVIFPGPEACHRVVVEIPGTAYRIRSDALREAFTETAIVQDVLLSCSQRMLARLSRSALCQRFHTVPQRLASWLLVVEDHAQSNTLQLTQPAIARVLGIHRTDVTTAASELKRAGVVWYRHGRMVIVDRRRLEREACDCYRALDAATTRRSGSD